jgi:heat-inducible transcriptional repressor
MDQESLSRLSNQLNEQWKGLTGSQISARLAAQSALSNQLAQLVSQAMNSVDSQEVGAIYRDGLAHILAEPEFAEGEQVRQMVQTLEGSSLAEVVLTATEPLAVGGIQVLIGGEGRWRDFAELSLVLSRYGVEGRASGLLGVVGPIRMSYDYTIGAVRYVSQLMSDLVNDWFDVHGEMTAPTIG